MIQRLAQEQDQRIAHDRRSSESGEPQAGPSGVRERRESSSSGLRAVGERRASSAGPTSDHSYAVATQHDPLSPRASKYFLCNCTVQHIVFPSTYPYSIPLTYIMSDD